jgi:hypothetical protein
MKTIRRTLLMILVSLFLTALPARAALYLTSDPQFGPNSVTVDTSTGLGWLGLTESVGLSYDQVIADMQPGGIFNGFRYASSQEVLTLYNSAGITGTGYYALSTPSISTLISLMGPTGTFNGEPEINGITGTSSGSTQYAAAIYASIGPNGPLLYLVTCGPGIGSVSYGDPFSFPDVGSWLVKEVPEPSSAAFVFLAIALPAGVTILRRQASASGRAGGFFL